MYNYYEAIKEDVKSVLLDDATIWNQSRDDLEQQLNDDLWIDDSVTGNGSSSYTFNREMAKEYVLDNTELMLEAFEAFGQVEEIGQKMAADEWEFLDVTIRCHLLGPVIAEVLDEAEELGYFTETEKAEEIA